MLVFDLASALWLAAICAVDCYELNVNTIAALQAGYAQYFSSCRKHVISLDLINIFLLI